MPVYYSNTNNGIYDYYCGIYYLMQITYAWGYPVTQWEPFNEPDIPQPNYSTNLTAVQASNLWVWATLAASYFPPETLAALTLSSMTNPADGTLRTSYVQDYVNALKQGGNAVPTTFALHDYLDVTRDAAYQQTGFLTDLNAFKTALAGVGVTNESIWLSEAGVWMNSNASDGNRGYLGPDVDGNGLSQAWGALGFKTLASQPQVTRANWYELQSFDNNNRDYDRFDSALLGADGSGTDNGNTNGLYVFRPGYCVLAWGYTPAQANSTGACHDTIGFTGPAESCGSGGPFNLPETQVAKPPDTDWEDPCVG